MDTPQHHSHSDISRPQTSMQSMIGERIGDRIAHQAELPLNSSVRRIQTSHLCPHTPPTVLHLSPPTFISAGTLCCAVRFTPSEWKHRSLPWKLQPALDPASSAKWVIHLQGGGECVTAPECMRHLFSPVGSSKFFPPFVNFSFDPDALPDTRLYDLGGVWHGARGRGGAYDASRGWATYG